MKIVAAPLCGTDWSGAVHLFWPMGKAKVTSTWPGSIVSVGIEVVPRWRAFI